MNDPTEMSPDQLREEVWHWRKNTAATLSFARSWAQAAEKTDQNLAADVRVRVLMPQRAALAEALAGDFHQACEACGQPLLNGQMVFQGHDSNDMHAACLGDVTSTEGFVDPDGDPLPADAPIPQPHVYDDGFDAARIAEELRLTDAYLHEPDEVA